MGTETLYKVIADENIPLVKDAFAEFGSVTTVGGRNITKEMLADASMLLVRSITNVNRELLEGTPVKFVATATIGTDHIDLNYLRDNNIGFAYAPASNADSVAEYVTAAMLTLAKKRNVRLSDLTLGIIGVGNVGSRVYRLAGTLGMKCLLNDPPKKRLTQSDIYVPLDTLLGNADIITVHVPLNTQGEDLTYRMINHDFFTKAREGVILINTSRGKVVDEKSVRAFRDKLGGLVLDVWEGEPGISTETLKMTDIGTSHIAGYSYDGKLRGTQMIYDAACAFFFRQPSWHIPESITTEIVSTIDISESKNPVYDAVLSAYPVMRDDSALRKIADKGTREEQEKYFDELRKKYPRRDEFSHYTIKCKKEQSAVAILLSNLGFRFD
jgi:erythronate-4-phosphate dehydrogenase